MEAVTRHPFAGWVTDSLGESQNRTFGADVPLMVNLVAPGPSRELMSGADNAVATDYTLYFDATTPTTSKHDDWTVRGGRCEQVGEAESWQDEGDWVTVVRVNRRTG